MKKSKLLLMFILVVAISATFGSSIIWATSAPVADIGQVNETSNAVRAANLDGSYKTVNATTALNGDVLTYTIVVSNSGDMAANVTLTDTMPISVSDGVVYFPTTYSGTVNLPGGSTQLPGVGSANLPGGIDWIWTGVVSPNTQIQIIVVVNLQTGFWNPITLTNRIDINDGAGNVITKFSGSTVYDPKFYIYLPIVMKNYPVTLPPVSCAPTFLQTIDVGNEPRGLALDQARNLIYVANYQDNSVSVINRNSYSVVKTIAGITSANGIAYDPNTDTIWVTNTDADQVTPIDASSYAVGTPLTVGDAPWGVVYNPVDKFIYVANSGSATVSVIDTSVGGGTVVLPNIQVGATPYNLAAHSSTGVVYVANFGSKSVSVINNAGTLQAPIGLTGSQPFGIDIDESRNYVYVSTLGGTIETIKINEGHANFSITFRRNSNDIIPMRALAVNGAQPDGGHLWTNTSTADGNNALNKILVIPKGFDVGFNKVLPYPDGVSTTIPNGNMTNGGIALDAAANYVFYSMPELDQVWIMGDAPAQCYLGTYKDGKAAGRY